MAMVTSPEIDRETRALGWTMWYKPREGQAPQGWMEVGGLARLAIAIIERDYSYKAAEDTLWMMGPTIARLMAGATFEQE